MQGAQLCRPVFTRGSKTSARESFCIVVGEKRETEIKREREEERRDTETETKSEKKPTQRHTQKEPDTDSAAFHSFNIQQGRSQPQDLADTPKSSVDPPSTKAKTRTQRRAYVVEKRFSRTFVSLDRAMNSTPHVTGRTKWPPSWMLKWNTLIRQRGTESNLKEMRVAIFDQEEGTRFQRVKKDSYQGKRGVRIISHKEQKVENFIFYKQEINSALRKKWDASVKRDKLEGHVTFKKWTVACTSVFVYLSTCLSVHSFIYLSAPLFISLPI